MIVFFTNLRFYFSVFKKTCDKIITMKLSFKGNSFNLYTQCYNSFGIKERWLIVIISTLSDPVDFCKNKTDLVFYCYFLCSDFTAMLDEGQNFYAHFLSKNIQGNRSLILVKDDIFLNVNVRWTTRNNGRQRIIDDRQQTLGHGNNTYFFFGPGEQTLQHMYYNGNNIVERNDMKWCIRFHFILF